MSRDPLYDVLFEPVKIGPKIAPNRFYQVPHCNGMGHRWPQSMAAMRGVKAEGGWGVVCTEECEIHPTSDLSGYTLMRLWDDSDLPAHELMVEKVHAHGSLAGIQLVHNGVSSANRLSRVAPLAPSPIMVKDHDPIQARAMTKDDIREVRRWHRNAVHRAKRAGYDIVYVYAAHTMTLLTHFLSPDYNHRSDEYGGSLENRARLMAEILDETMEAAKGEIAVAVRYAVHDAEGDDALRCHEEGRAVVEMFADIPDLWDVNVTPWEHDSMPSRFGREGGQEPFTSFVKSVTSKPVVGVGRYTSPDKMVSLINKGMLDFIGAARPSIADPFLPKKIEEGRIEDIRECIGCNICITADFFAVPLRCTQNPTMGEEWRKGWHPEEIPPAGSDDKVLVVGGGPAGLECALALGKRGYEVVLAEGESELGGRVLLESRLPGLAEWKRVIDHRTYMLSQMPNVQTYVKSRLGAADILDYGFERVVLASGAAWRSDGVGRTNRHPIAIADAAGIVSVDEILRGKQLTGRVVVFDDDLYYLASAIAEKLSDDGCRVTYVTPATQAADWSVATLEQFMIQKRLLSKGVEVICTKNLAAAGRGEATLACIYSGRETKIEADSFVLVTARLPDDSLLAKLTAHGEKLADHGIKAVEEIGDCYAPGTIAMAVYAGHQYARQLDNPVCQKLDFKRENYQPPVA
jgi:dimethylamine/trimethylamine dehydrogenase